jgi:thiamine biosynthesis lipoprotein
VSVSIAPEPELEPLRGLGFRVETVMAMPIGIDLRDSSVRSDPRRADAVLDGCFDRLREVDDLFSLWRPDTPMARLVAGTADLTQMPPTVVGVLRQCVRAARETGGHFSARDPAGHVDPTGLVKGWAVSEVGRLLLGAGYQHWCISAAGDVLVHGRPEPTEAWVIGIAAPGRPGDLLDAVQLESGGAVATSGTAERGHHIWDPLQGRPAHGIRSATVVCSHGQADDIVRADVLATAAVARGRGAIAWLGGLTGVDAFIVHDNGRQEATSGWIDRSIVRERA